jgi:flagellar motility protein MotE (MotC chaperone)
MCWSERRRGRLLALGLLLAAAAWPAAAGDAPAASACAEQDAGALLAQIRAQGLALDRRERLVQEREQTDAAARKEASLRLQELETLRLGVEERLVQLEAATEERVERLADLYGRMPPERAAALIDALEPDLSARILAGMRRPRAAAVLAALPGARAADLSRRIVRPLATMDGAPPLASAGKRRMSSGAASVP